MKKIKFNRSNIITAIVMLAAGLLIGWLIKPTSSTEIPHEGHELEVGESSTAAVWTCSMHPQIRQSEPGQCPICGMDLIPLEDDAEMGDPRTIRMSPTAMQLANVQTAVVGFGTATREVRMNGKVQPDERLIFSQVTHLEGRVEQLAVNFTGEQVRKGQKLATIYSPELVTAQSELFSAQKIKDMQPGLFNAAKEKLKNWKLTDQQIEDILAAGAPQERFPILADVSGIVMEKKVNLGDYVMRGMPLYDIVDLSRVWVLFDVYESDMPWVKVGSTVSFTVQSLPGENFTGKISFIDPLIDPATRVATARVEIANPGGKLKPEMFVSGVVKTQLKTPKETLMAPKTAVLWTGERSVVYVKTETEQGIGFQMREVSLGPLVGDNYVIEAGLEAGTEIVVNGTFAIDAASQLAGKPSMMSPEGGAVVTGHQHDGIAPPAAAPVAPMPVSRQAEAAVQRLFDQYFLLKNALVEDDWTAAKKKAAELKKAFVDTDMSLFKGEAHDLWMKHSDAAIQSLDRFVASAGIAEARVHFKPLSAAMIALAKAFGPLDETIYLQHCPMADNNAGADWLSRESRVLNPYFGSEMLTCGSVKETIRKDAKNGI